MYLVSSLLMGVFWKPLRHSCWILGPEFQEAQWRFGWLQPEEWSSLKTWPGSFLCVCDSEMERKCLWFDFHLMFCCGPCTLHGPWLQSRAPLGSSEGSAVQIKKCISAANHICAAAGWVQSWGGIFGSSCRLSLVIRSRTDSSTWHNRFTQSDWVKKLNVCF